MRRFEQQVIGPFDTVTQVVGYSKSQEEFDQWMSLIYQELSDAHRQWTPYPVEKELPLMEETDESQRQGSIREINDAQIEKKITTDPVFFRQILAAIQLSRDTQEAMNVAFGPVTELWHEARQQSQSHPEKTALPGEEKLRKAAGHCDLDSFVLDEVGLTICKKDAQAKLDPGAYAKGASVEQIASRFSKDHHSLLISSGGDVRAVGRKPTGERWKVAVRNPKGADLPYLDVLYLEDEALVTSGVYERCFEFKGESYHHIIDPVTLFPSDRFESVSVCGKDAGLCDGLSTALMNLSLEDGQELAERYQVGVLWVSMDGKQNTNQAWNNRRASDRGER